MGNITENIAGIKAKIVKSGSSAQLIAVSKNHGEDAVREALAAGQRIFGENRVQEAAGKFPQLRGEFPDLSLHLIGPLQTNKVKDALELFDVIQTLDREKLAVALAQNYRHSQVAAGEPGNLVQGHTRSPGFAKGEPEDDKRIRTKEFFVQVNIGEEEQKAGIAPKDAVAFYKYCRDDLKLNVTGLMCIPPVEEKGFMYFALLRNIAAQLGKPKLSMGMSGDYEDALELGADYVRIGTGVFGAR